MGNEVLTPERLTIIGMLLGIIAAGARKVWVWGYQLVESELRKKESDEAYESRLTEIQERARRWETVALRALNVGEKVIQSNERREQ